MKTICPSDGVLRRYALGDIDDFSGEELDQHLAGCADCEEAITGHDTARDLLTRHLPLVARTAERGELPRPDWLDRLRDGPPANGPSMSEALDEKEPFGPLPELSVYELVCELGRGGMGVVYRARHKQLNRDVALKVLHPRLMSTLDAQQRFEREIQILGGLDDPGIVRAVDAGRSGPAAYLVMELVDGIDLAKIVRHGGPLSVEQSCEAAGQMAQALAAAHRAGAVHRDLKPSNVMVDRQGRVKLLDFGLAHLELISAGDPETSLGRLIGTLDYMAPEQANQDQPPDPKIDLYGLGATLYFLLAGRPPHGDHAGQPLLVQLRSLTSKDVPAINSLRGDIPTELSDFIAELLSREPDDRPSSSDAVAAKLASWSGGDLGSYVAEIGEVCGVAASSQNDSEAAKRSLSALLGSECAPASESSAGSSAKPSPEPPRRPTRRWWLAAATLFVAALLYGVTIVLETPEGTLRIESDIDDVRVELVNEQDQLRQLRIARGKNETTLRTGRYRVRLGGGHDDITIDKTEILLRRDQVTIARLTRVHPAQAGDPEPAASVPERRYKERTESEWQRLFDTETASPLRLEAASALAILASELEPERRFERVMMIGEQLVRSRFDDDSIQATFESGFDTPVSSSVRTSLTSEEASAFLAQSHELTNQIRISARSLPASDVARILCDAILEGGAARGSFAVALFRDTAARAVAADAAASQIVMQRLDVSLTGLDRSAVFLLLRARCARQAPPEQRQEVFESLQALAAMLEEARGRSHREYKNELLELIREFDSMELPPALVENVAKMVLNTVAGGSMAVFSRLSNTSRPFDQTFIVSQRRKLPEFTGTWLDKANGYLKQYPYHSNKAAVRNLLRTLENVLHLHADDDDWPVQETAALYTAILRGYYTSNLEQATDQAVSDLLPAAPATLMKRVVAITGEIPRYVQTGHPKPRSVLRRLRRLEILLSVESTSAIPDEFDLLAGLLDEAPYQVIRLCAANTTYNTAMPIIVRGSETQATPVELLYALSSINSKKRNAPPTDALLLLTVLADLTGQAEVKDQRIAMLLSPTSPRLLLRGHLEDLLSSDLAARKIARAQLRKMATASKCEDLIDAIDYLDSTIVDARADVSSPDDAAQNPRVRR